jgi:putative IMPACT (imprinted ancient) family translation regulator
MGNLSTLVATVTARQEIKKSRFLAAAGPISDEATAKAFIAANSDQTANHNCWAWRIGQAYRFSDDGEPGGTAGKPICRQSTGGRLIVSPSSSRAGSAASCSGAAG